MLTRRQTLSLAAGAAVGGALGREARADATDQAREFRIG